MWGKEKVVQRYFIVLIGMTVCSISFAIESGNYVQQKKGNAVELNLTPETNFSLIDYILAAEDQVEGATPLVLDDGTAETSVGDEGQFIWLNRFTPDPAEYPFQLEEVSVIFGNTLVNVGDAIEILIYEDTDNDGDPGTGAVLLASFNDTIQFNDQITFSVFTLSSPVVLTGPGDVLIGVVNRSGFETNNDFPAGIDQTTSVARSWAATYLVGDVPSNPTLPGDEQWGTIDSFGLPGNWNLRGAGTDGFLLGGSVTGLLAGNELIIQNMAGNDLTISTDGDYHFGVLSQDTDSYDVTVLQHPTGPSQTCLVANSTGAISGSSVNNINISCDNLDLIYRNGFE